MAHANEVELPAAGKSIRFYVDWTAPGNISPVNILTGTKVGQEHGEALATSMGKISEWYDWLIPAGGQEGQVLTWDTDYTVTSSQPSDWTTNYKSYYTKSGDNYIPVTGNSAPTWAANTYYKFAAGIKPYKWATPTVDVANLTGTLPVSKGGTGKTSFTTNAIITGNGSGDLTEVTTAAGAAYASSADGVLTFGTLDVPYGGTGATTAAGARTNLEVYSKTEVDQKIDDTRKDLVKIKGVVDETSDLPAEGNHNGDVYYVGEEYILLTETPSDWSTNWTDYYKKSGNDYVHVTGSSAPTFATDTYYKKNDEGYEEYIWIEDENEYSVTTSQPSDWTTNYKSYYTKSGNTYTPVTGDTAPTWASNTYYEHAGDWEALGPRSFELPDATTNQKGIVQLTDSVTDSTTTAITPHAVQQALSGLSTYSAGTGIDISLVSGTNYSIKTKLKSGDTATSNAINVATVASGTANKFYPVQVDKDGYLAVNVPWANDDVKTKQTTVSTDAKYYPLLFGNTGASTMSGTPGNAYISTSTETNGVKKYGHLFVKLEDTGDDANKTFLYSDYFMGMTSTQAAGTNTNALANCAFVQQEISSAVSGLTSVSYTQQEDGTGTYSYTIGTITIDETPNVVYGRDTTYSADETSISKSSSNVFSVKYDDTSNPAAPGTASPGSASTAARSDHVHPLQTSVSGSAGYLATGRAIDGVIFDGTKDIDHYGECSTTASTSTKSVSIMTNNADFKLVNGAVAIVKFTVTNTAAVSGLKLQVNGTTAKNIKYRGANLPSADVLSSGRIYKFVYDGTYWQLVGDLNTTYDVVTKTEDGLVGAPGNSPTGKYYKVDDNGVPSWTGDPIECDDSLIIHCSA